MNAALFGLAGKSWIVGAAALREQEMIEAIDEKNIQKIWHFGQLIANTDMHDGNLAFRPGMTIAPVYDMLPMLYAPVRGLELPQRTLAPELPMPAELDAWNDSAQAAVQFWMTAASDTRISDSFRHICLENVEKVRLLTNNSMIVGR